MGFLNCLPICSSSNPHRSYQKYLKPSRPKANPFTKIRKYASRFSRRYQSTKYSRLDPSEKTLPYGIPEDLPNYEDAERRDKAKAVDPSWEGDWRIRNLNIKHSVIDADGNVVGSQNFSTRWEFLQFFQDQVDQITVNRMKLEAQVADVRRDLDEAKQQNAEERELKQLLQLHVDAERTMAENMLVGDIEEEQRRTGRQI
ncbi:MAG: hypothetical protein Q9168_004095 [Polycauliona sp. 1 TL-2023]